jgi:hypothetical protein
MNKKGIFFSLDAIIAIMIAVVLFSIAFFYLAQVDIHETSSTDLVEYSRSVLVVMEKDEVLMNSILSDSSLEVVEFLDNYTKDHSCFSLEVEDVNGVQQYLVYKTGCGSTVEKDVVKRTFIVNKNDIYLAKMEVYYG